MTGPIRRPKAVSAEPTFTFIIPVYNVAPFLPAFLDSLSAQVSTLIDCELIFVNDGSTDASGTIIRDWMEQTQAQAELVEQENQGLSAARNVGLERASGTWISFPDPDDVLDPEYLGKIAAFLTASPAQPDLVCAHVLLLDDSTGEISDTHPLHTKFSRGTQLVNMEHSPEYIHLQAASAFYRRARIERLGLQFDSAIKPNFEDSSFTVLYLSASDEPLLGIVADALYMYRRRSDGGSLVQQSWAKESKYTTLLERGYLSLLQQVEQSRGQVPIWAQNTVLYDLLFFYRHEQSTHGPTGLADPEWSERFHSLAEQIFKYIDVETIDAFSIMPTSRQLKDALIIGYYGERLVPKTIRLIRVDIDQQLVQIRYFFGGDLPVETFRVSGVSVEPVYGKIRELTYLHRVLLRERIVWLPATAEIRVFLNGRRMPLEFGPEPEPVYTARPNLTWRRLTRRRRAPAAPSPANRAGRVPAPTTRITLEKRLEAVVRARFPRSVPMLRRARRALARPSVPAQVDPGPFAELDPRQDRSVVTDARSRRCRRLYGHAWTFIDRDTEAHDNAEHLYRYVRLHQPDINAWFVLRRESPDWDRLAEEGFRLVPFGTAEHVQLLLNTDHLLSSQVDHYIVRPLDVRRFGRKAWRYTFLQHGVTKDDLSRWLNSKPISRFVTASTAEHQSVAGDHTPYVFTDKEVRLTGFPRHDRLLRLKNDVQRPDLILIMPTWRRSLLREAQGGNARRLRVPLTSTAFGRAWFDLIGSSELKAIADQAGLEIMLMPHPNMQSHVSDSDVPSWVRVCTYDSTDVQEVLVRAAVIVTDYSSQAFEAAYVERAVVYYQFDRAEFFGGTHVYRKGTWDYDQDGFGPVALTQREALAAIDSATTLGNPEAVYLERMRQTFPHRDGRCCERTFASVAALTQPVPYERAFRPIAGDQSTQIDASHASGPIEALDNSPRQRLSRIRQHRKAGSRTPR